MRREIERKLREYARRADIAVRSMRNRDQALQDLVLATLSDPELDALSEFYADVEAERAILEAAGGGWCMDASQAYERHAQIGTVAGRVGDLHRRYAACRIAEEAEQLYRSETGKEPEYRVRALCGDLHG